MCTCERSAELLALSEQPDLVPGAGRDEFERAVAPLTLEAARLVGICAR